MEIAAPRLFPREIKVPPSPDNITHLTTLNRMLVPKTAYANLIEKLFLISKKRPPTKNRNEKNKPI